MHIVNQPNQPNLRQSTQAMEKISSSELQVEIEYATLIAKSRAVPDNYRQDPGSVLVLKEWARNHDVDIFTALHNVSYIKGRPVIDASLMRAMAEKAGYKVRISNVSNESVTVTISKNGEELGKEIFTIEDARRADLTNNQTWKKYPRNMLIARATSNAIRFYAPSVIAGVYTPEEMESVAQQPTKNVKPSTPAEVATTVKEAITDAEIIEEEETPSPLQTFTDEIQQAVETITTTPLEEKAQQIQAKATTVETNLAELKDLLKEHKLTQSDCIRVAQTVAKDYGLELPGSLKMVVQMPDEAYQNLISKLFAVVDAEAA